MLRFYRLGVDMVAQDDCLIQMGGLDAGRLDMLRSNGPMLDFFPGDRFIPDFLGCYRIVRQLGAAD
ncbi:hypothetical protein D3C81_2295640 [compost metagenome]